MPPPPAPAAGSGEDDDFDWDDLDDEDDEAPAPVVAVKMGPIPFKEPSPATPAAPPPPPAAAAPPPAAAARPAPTASPPAATNPGPPPAVFSRPGAAPPAAVTPTTPAAAAGPRPPAPAATGGQRRVVPPPPAAPGAVPPPPAPPAATAVRPPPPPAAATAAGTAAAGPSPAAVPAPPQSGTPPSSSRPAAPGSPSPGSAGAAAAARPEGQPSQTAPPAAAPSPPPEQRQQPPMGRSSSGGGGSAGKPPRPQPAARSAPDAGSAGGNAGSSSSGGSAGGSWGGWGLGGLSNKLQQVALGAAKDLQELTASVQQVVAEVVAADDVSEAERLSAYQPQPSHPPALSPGATSAPPAPLTARRDSSGTRLSAAAGDSSTSELAAAGGGGEGQGDLELKRQQVLQKLQGQDTQLESGLKVIDEQVDMLAASVAKGLGSLWGGLNTVAKTSWTVGAALTNKVEAAAQEVVKELVVGLEEGVSAVAPAAAGAASLREAAEQLAARAERSLETVGRGAAQLLDPQFARRHQPGDGASGASGGGRSAADWEATFGSCFELYGGSQAAEELEQLSSECAHICNRARAELAQQHRDQIDRSLSLLLPAFDLSKPKQPSAEGDAAAAPSVDEAVAEALEQLYLPVTALVNKGRFKLSQVQQQADSSASAAAAADAKAAAEAEAAAAGAQAAAEAGEEVPPAAGEEIVAAPAAGQAAAAESKDSSGSNTERLLLRLLAALRSAAVKSLAEVSAGQLMLLLALGRSLASVPRYGKPLDDGLTWPPESGATATLLRQQAEAMLADLTQLAGSFSAAAPALLATLQQAAAAAATTGQQAWLVEQGQQLQAQAVEEVGVDCSAAVAQVRDGFGKLLYVVLLASLHREGLQQKQQGPLQPQQQQGQQQPELMQDNEGEQEQA